MPTNSPSTRSSTFIIAYPVDEGFLRNPLVQRAQHDAQFRQLHDVLAAVFDDPKIQLAMRHDLLNADSQAAWNGRRALPLVVTGCLAVVRRLMGWSYRVLADQVNVSAGWRWVCQLYDQPMPNFRTIRDREALLKPKTVKLIQAKVVQLGQAVGVTTGTRLRVDSSVTESDIHYPTDSSLLNDAARVLESADAASARGAEPADLRRQSLVSGSPSPGPPPGAADRAVGAQRPQKHREIQPEIVSAVVASGGGAGGASGLHSTTVGTLAQSGGAGPAWRCSALICRWCSA